MNNCPVILITEHIVQQKSNVTQSYEILFYVSNEWHLLANIDSSRKKEKNSQISLVYNWEISRKLQVLYIGKIGKYL